MRQLHLLQFLHTHPLHNSLLIGFYGGGNYGDELLMEILAGLLKAEETRGVSIAYQQPALYDKFHHDFGYPRVNIHSKAAMIRAFFKHRTLVAGGGGLWGMDTNPNIFLMSLMLFLGRWFMGKRVYLLSVGFYDSAPRLGRISAWFAAKAANEVLARDEESYRNFKRLQPATKRDADIVWYVDQLNLLPYREDLEALEAQLKVSGKTLFITLRRFNTNDEGLLKALVEECVRANPDKSIIIALMEPRHVDPAGYRQLRAWQRQFANVQTIDCGFNPLALFLFFRAHRDELVFIGPQFHGILSAHLSGVPYLPVAYDNKVVGLLKHIAPEATPIKLHSLRSLDLQRFIDHSYGETV